MTGFPHPDTRTPAAPPGRITSWPLRILGVLAGFMILFLAVGWALPGTWSVERTRVVDAPPERVFAWLDAPAGWRAWTAWPEAARATEGPARGVGAGVRWDDETWGSGAFSITRSEPPRLLGYEVRVEDGAMVTRGVLRLEDDAGGTRVVWRESGDFGWNPLMGYAALGMDRMQGAEMEKGLARLDSVAASAPAPGA